MSIETNVRTSEEMAFIEEYIDSFQDDVASAIRAKLQEKYTIKWETCDPVDPMDDQEARAFKGRVFPIRGLYFREYVADVPASYIIWLTEENKEFMKQLQRYAKSDRFARVQE